MARRSRMSMLKRQRELRKAEKAARKRARRHGLPEEVPREPVPTLGAAALQGLKPPADEDEPVGSAETGTERDEEKQDTEEKE